MTAAVNPVHFQGEMRSEMVVIPMGFSRFLLESGEICGSGAAEADQNMKIKEKSLGVIENNIFIPQ